MVVGLAFTGSAIGVEEQRRRLRSRRCSAIVEDDAGEAMGMLGPGDTLVVADAKVLGEDAEGVLSAMESVAVMGATLVIAGPGKPHKGKPGGRPKADPRAVDDALARYDEGEKVPEICAATGIGRSTLYRAIQARGNPPDT